VSQKEAKKQVDSQSAEPVETPVDQPQDSPGEEVSNPLLEALEQLKESLGQQEERYLRLAAEYDNFRKRSQKEKEGIYADAKADALTAFLPVYDNLERALKQETTDEAYKKGVEMTMSQLKEIMSKLGISEIPALGQSFDPNFHNAVMHIDDDNVGENTIVEVFQAGFKLEEKVIRFAVVKVAN
jgi:molecular chaperone GrpE